MKRLDRYVIISFLTAWVASFVFFAGMYLVIHFFNKIGSMSESIAAFEAAGVGAVQGLCLYYGLNLPFVMVQTAPYTVLMGAMWSAQQLARRNELVPVLMAGVSLRRLSLPILLSGFLLALIFAGVREEVLPAIATARHNIERLHKGKKTDVISRIRQIPGANGEVVHIREYDVSTRVAYGVNVLPPPGSSRGRVYYESVPWSDADGWPAADDAPTSTALLTETGLHPRDIEIESRRLLFLDVSELRRLISRYPDRSDLRLRLHAHFAYPAGVMVLLLMGLPLVLKTTQRTPFMAAGVSLLLSMAFFATQTVLQDLGGRDEILNPVLGAWLPIVVFGSLGLLFFETMST